MPGSLFVGGLHGLTGDFGWSIIGWKRLRECICVCVGVVSICVTGVWWVQAILSKILQLWPQIEQRRAVMLIFLSLHYLLCIYSGRACFSQGARRVKRMLRGSQPKFTVELNSTCIYVLKAVGKSKWLLSSLHCLSNKTELFKIICNNRHKLVQKIQKQQIKPYWLNWVNVIKKKSLISLKCPIFPSLY